MTGVEMAEQDTAIDVSDLDDLADSLDAGYELSQNPVLESSFEGIKTEGFEAESIEVEGIETPTPQSRHYWACDKFHRKLLLMPQMTVPPHRL